MTALDYGKKKEEILQQFILQELHKNKLFTLTRFFCGEGGGGGGHIYM